MKKAISVLEIGTHKVRVVIGRVHDNDKLEIMGLGECPSQGVSKGGVNDVAKVEACVRNAIKTAENQANRAANDLHCVFSSRELRSKIHQAYVPVLNDDQIISKEHVDDVQATAQSASFGDGRQKVHFLPQFYSVDEQHPTENPIGTKGDKLFLTMLTLHVPSNHLINLGNIVSNIGARPASFAFSGLCAAQSSITEDQMNRGTLLIDLGAGTTGFAFCADGFVAYTGSVPVGGLNVTKDIARGLQLTEEQAERAKCIHSDCLNKPLGHTKHVVRLMGGPKGEDVSIHLPNLNTVAHARLKETFELIQNQLDQQGILHRLSAGVQLVGGGASMKNIEQLAEKVFKTQCWIGEPFETVGLPEDKSPASYAAPVGMIRYVHDTESSREGERKSFLSILGRKGK